MGRSRSERDRQTAAMLLIVFGALLFAMVVLEVVLMKTHPGRNTLAAAFLRASSTNFVAPMFLAYLVIGVLGFIGSLGLCEVYAPSRGLLRDTVRLSSLGYFLTSYWLWAAVWIVQYKVTLLTDRPSNPPDWLLNLFDASDALWALPSWGSLGPSLVLFGALFFVLRRGTRLLPRVAGWAFAALAVSRFVSLVAIGGAGLSVDNSGGLDVAFLNDMFFMFAQIAAFLLAGLALYSEREEFVRGHRS